MVMVAGFTKIIAVVIKQRPAGRRRHCIHGSGGHTRQQQPFGSTG